LTNKGTYNVGEPRLAAQLLPNGSSTRASKSTATKCR